MKRLLLLTLIAISSIACTAKVSDNAAQPAEPKQYFAKAGDFATFEIGDVKFTTLVDASAVTDTSKLIGYTEDEKKKLTPTDKVGHYVDAFIATVNGKNILFDTGYGVGKGKMMEAMANAGFSADMIDTIILTHMHADHIGGLLTDLKPTFTKATLFISAPERKFWYETLRTNRGEGAMLARAVIEAYGDRVKTFNFGDKISPEITSMDAVGHTPGHTAYLITSKGENLLVWGDIMHVIEVQMALPSISITYDNDPVKARETRIRIMNEVVKNNWKVAGMHLPFPALGNIKKKGDGFEWIVE